MRKPTRAAVLAGAALAAAVLAAGLPGPAGSAGSAGAAGRPGPAQLPARAGRPASSARLSDAVRAALPQPPGPDRRAAPAPERRLSTARAHPAGSLRVLRRTAGRVQRPWQLAAAAHAGPAGNLSGYTSVLALSRADAWAFGGTNPGGASAPIAAHWNGRSWRPVALPRGLHGFIASASAAAPRDIWALSYPGTYLLHWDGRRWSVSHRFRAAGALSAVTAVSRSQVWAFTAGPRGGVWRFTARGWLRRPAAPGPVLDASAAGRHQIWAIVQRRRGRAVFRREHGRWARIRAGAALTAMTPTGILAISSTDVWITGTRASGSGVLVAHWDGTHWQRFAAHPGLRPEQPAPDGHGGIWIPTSSGPLTSARWILHLSASGRWTSTAFATGAGSSAGDLALIPGTWSLWGSGGLLHGAGGDAAIWLHGRTPGRPAPRRPAPDR